MIRISSLLSIGFLLAGTVPSQSAPMSKGNISVGEARRELGAVAAYQNFPSKYRLDRAGTLRIEEEYYHIFTSRLSKDRLWRTLVFANSGDYLGYYETPDQSVALEKDALVFPGESYSEETGDAEEDEYDSGDAHIIKFSAAGPPDEVKFETRSYIFVSSPLRVRPEDPGYRYIQLANRVTDAMNRGRYKRVRDDFSPQALHRISEQETEETLARVREKLGRVERVDAPWIQSSNTAVLPITFEHAVAGLKLTLTDADEIAGMWILPFAEAFPTIGKNRTPMTLPFDRQWRLMWGGDRRDQSKYFGSRVGHYALEFVRSSRFGKTYREKGRRNRDYLAFDQPVRAPAAGVVVAVINGVKDNRPHSPDPFDPLGNAIMIKHSTNEFSVVGHLKLNSIRVRVGDEVQARQLIAQVGNSGNSSQPSLYFHLQDSPEILSGSGYRTVFSNVYLKNGTKLQVLSEYSPVRGEFVQQRLMSKKTASARESGKPEAKSK